jgi:hypothetical protein
MARCLISTRDVFIFFAFLHQAKRMLTLDPQNVLGVIDRGCQTYQTWATFTQFYWLAVHKVVCEWVLFIDTPCQFIIIATKLSLTNCVAPGPEGSSPHSQEPATGPYPEPGGSTPHPPPPTILPRVRFNHIFPSAPWSSKWFFSFGLSLQNPVHVSFFITQRYNTNKTCVRATQNKYEPRVDDPWSKVSPQHERTWYLITLAIISQFLCCVWWEEFDQIVRFRSGRRQTASRCSNQLCCFVFLLSYQRGVT